LLRFFAQRTARFCPLYAAPTVIGGFRLHGGNLSTQGAQAAYLAELRQHGACLLPPALTRWPRFAYRVMAAISALAKTRRPLSEKS
jgi:hypothetical protein